MINSDIYINAILQGIDIVFSKAMPYIIALIIGAVGVAIIKSIVASMIDFLTLELNSSQSRNIKKSAFKLIDVLSELSNIFSNKK